MKMKKQLDIKKLLLLNMPYILMGLFATNFGEGWRMAVGADASAKMLSFFSTLPVALASWWPSLHPLDLLVGLCCGAGLRLAVYLKSKNAKKYRHGMEYGSARWGTHEDIAPYIDPVFQNNVILTKTESLTMNSRPKDPKTARNKNVLVIGGSGSGKTRFWLKPNLMQMHSSYVVTDPKGTILVECGKMLQRGTPKLGKDGKPMPAEQIAFIHEAKTEVQKKELFSKVRTGQVRVLLGSTSKMGAGTNVQDRLVALHDLDCPWRPGDLAQRKGRIERQGNQNPLVHVYRYVTEGTFDAYLWQTVENKQKFISQIMTSKSPVRSCDDVDETALSFAEIKALCAGDPRIKERMDLDVEGARLKLMKADHQSKQYRLEDQLLKYFPQEIETNKGFIKGFEANLETLAAHPHPEDGFAGMEIRGDVLTDKENAGAALLDACKEVKGSEPVQIGSYRGFTMSVEFSAWKQEYTLLLKGQMTHRASLGTDPRGNLTRIDNALAQMPQRLEAVKNQLDNLYQQQAAAKEEIGKPFPFEDDLRVKSARLVELDTLLNIDGKGHAQPETVVAKSARPSVLDSLKRPVPPRSPEKKPKQHEEVR